MSLAPKTGSLARVYVRRFASESPVYKVDTGSVRPRRSTTLPDSEGMKGRSHCGKGGGFVLLAGFLPWLFCWQGDGRGRYCSPAVFFRSRVH